MSVNYDMWCYRRIGIWSVTSTVVILMKVNSVRCRVRAHVELHNPRSRTSDVDSITTSLSDSSRTAVLRSRRHRSSGRRVRSCWIRRS